MIRWPSVLDVPLRHYLTTPVESIDATATLRHARERMTGRRISALPVFDARGRATGVITRSDLLRVGREAATDDQTLVFDNRQVQEVVTRQVVTVSVDSTIGEAARHFLDEHIHRVFAESDGRIVGVLSGRDIMAALATRGLAMPISAVMSSPLHIIHARTAIGDAVDCLLADEVSSLVVHENDSSIGIFDRYEALRFGDQSPDQAVGLVVRPGVLALPASTPIGDAAARAISEDVRQLLVLDDGSLRETEPPSLSSPNARGGVLGIVTSIDLAGAALMAR